MCRDIIKLVNESQYISDIINKEDIDHWNTEEIVFIEAPTGKGKSHFIKHVLSEHDKNKRILILVNRIMIKNQSSKELLRQDIDNITITTYQNIINKIITRKEVEFKNYDYIICDESHFFCEDSEYIYEGDVCLDWILEQQNSIKIFMTATGYYIKKYIETKLNYRIKYYHITNKYDYIEKLYFYEDDDVIKKLLLDLPPNEKAIYFTSANKAHEMSKLLSSCVFYCSKNNLSYYGNVKLDSIKYIEENEMFEEQVLCTTKAMDCGVNIKDKAVKHIIVDMNDISTIIQCIGRKRILEDDKIILYIKNKKGNSISRKIESIEKRLYYANILKEQGTLKLIEENAHKNTYGNLIYDVINPLTMQIDKKVNELMYFTYNENLIIFKEMLVDKEDGFKFKLFERMGIDMQYNFLEEVLDAMKLEDILNRMVGIKMFSEEQTEFKNLLLKELLNAPKGSHGSIGLKTINALFDENKINYIVNSKREKSGQNRDKTYWVISKL